MIEQTIREKLPEGFQRAEYLLEHGMIDMVVHRHKMRETLSRVCRMLMGQPEIAKDISHELNTSETLDKGGINGHAVPETVISAVASEVVVEAVPVDDDEKVDPTLFDYSEKSDAPVDETTKIIDADDSNPDRGGASK